MSDRASPTGPLALVLVSVETGERRPLTFPQGTADAGDFRAAFSPDGRSLAFNRFTSWSAGDTYVLALGEDFSPKGEPRRMTSSVSAVSRPAWTQDGAVIVSFGDALWRIPAKGRGAAKRLDFVGEDAAQPAVSRTAKRLAYARIVLDLNVWAVETEGAAAGQPRPLLASTRSEFNPQFSPDGKKIAFASDRGGSMQIWVCDASGANATALSALDGPNVGTPRWSPDGSRIVFDAMVGGTRDLFVIDSRGGKARALTTQPTHERVPSWSRDGRWIYFSSNRGGTDQIWRMPAEGGEAVQVTRAGGYVAFESWDGTSLYYTKSAGTGPLFQLPLAGGEERKVLESVVQRAFAVTAKGIYFISARDPEGVVALQFLELASGKTTRISVLNRPLYLGLTASPDGRTVLYTQYDLAGSDLMLVENFR